MKKITYIPKKDRLNDNTIGIYSNQIMKSSIDNHKNQELHEKILKNGCIYIPNYICESNDYTIFNDLKSEIQNQNPIEWSKHLKYENPDFSQTFNKIVDKLCAEFNISPTATRLNYYRNGMDWKPFHHDSHAYGSKKENYTIGASFGCSRDMCFVYHDVDNPNIMNNITFKFPQHNGDIFAFNKEINKRFMHSIPKNRSNKDRFSIIVWGIKKKC